MPLNEPIHATPRPNAGEADIVVLVVAVQAVAVLMARGSSLLVAVVLSETVLQGARLQRRMLLAPTGLGVNARL
jgi:hypothetical protein